MTSTAPVSEAVRKRVLRVLVISLLMDLISFTFILPLFPRLLEFYRDREIHAADRTTLLSRTLSGLNSYKNAFSRPISSRYDIVLLGGAMGSLFSLCQAVASPVIGRLSDRHGRRSALLSSMLGNVASVALWVAAVDFRTFVASRVVGGLSEGNVQLATAIATDVSSDEQRGATMALVGACFSVAFTVGPALGAWLASWTTVSQNPFAAAAGFSLFLIVAETLYLYKCLPETLPQRPSPSPAGVGAAANGKPHETAKDTRLNANPTWLLNLTHFLFVLNFSGMEFSLPFMTYDLFSYTSARNGRLLGYLGLVASILQGGFVRRMHPLAVVRTGVVACAAAFFLLARLTSERELWVASTLLAITSGTVVTGLNSLSSFEAASGERGGVLGRHRSWGQIGRSLGPLIFCTLYWWAGRQVAYTTGGVGMLAVCGLVFGSLKRPAMKAKA